MALARRGVQHIIVADIELKDSEETVQLISKLGLGTSSRVVKCDCSSSADVDSLIDGTEKKEGPVDAFFANAGFGGDFGGADAASEELWKKMMAVNVYQSYFASRRLMPELAQRGGCFAITSSAAGLMTQMGSMLYSTTKHASRAIAEWLSITYGGYGLHVACLCPQAVETKMTAAMAAEHGGAAAAGPAGLDGIHSAEFTAECLMKALEAGKFLALPHAEVEKYMKFKANDVDKWLGAMRKNMKQNFAPMLEPMLFKSKL